MGNRRAVLLLTTVTVFVALALGPASPAAAASQTLKAAPPIPILTWTDCGGGFQCATAQVPLDYEQPLGQTISIALIRLPALDPSHRIGSLFINPGGPGGSGVDVVRAAGQFFPPVSTSSASIREASVKALRSSALPATQTSRRSLPRFRHFQSHALRRSPTSTPSRSSMHSARREIATCSRTCPPPTPTATWTCFVRRWAMRS
jgi:hypothetical protein